MTKPAHYRGRYHVQARRVRQTAYANPHTQCWRCGKTLQQIQQKHPQATWTAGHLVDGQAGGTLLPECSKCNYGAGARLKAQRAQARTRQRVTLRW